MTKRIALVALALTAACGGGTTSLGSPAPSPTSAPVPSATAAPVPTATTVPKPIPSFRSPESAMVYLASAWNRGDMTALKHVTDPSAREELWNMHREAANLKLKSCEKLEAGDYDCLFTHGYPVGYKGAHGAVGNAVFRVGPARRSGWYMTVYISCG